MHAKSVICVCFSTDGIAQAWVWLCLLCRCKGAGGCWSVAAVVLVQFTLAHFFKRPLSKVDVTAVLLHRFKSHCAFTPCTVQGHGSLPANSRWNMSVQPVYDFLAPPYSSKTLLVANDECLPYRQGSLPCSEIRARALRHQPQTAHSLRRSESAAVPNEVCPQFIC